MFHCVECKAEYKNPFNLHVHFITEHANVNITNKVVNFLNTKYVKNDNEHTQGCTMEYWDKNFSFHKYQIRYQLTEQNESHFEQVKQVKRRARERVCM